MRHWFAVHTKARCERFAEASLRHHGIEAFLPLIREVKEVHGHRLLSTVPMFPGYLFARCELPSEYRTVAYARGVKRFVSFGSGPAILEEALVEAIKQRIKSGVLEDYEREFAPGQAVRIEHGWLYGLEAVFQRQMSAAQRAVVLLRALSFQAKVNLETQYVSNL